MPLKPFSLTTLCLILTACLPAVAANPQHVQRLLKTNQCPLCDLSGGDFTDANLFGANLVGANLKGALLNGANLGSANLTDADLTGAKLVRAYFDRATLENANFTQADLSAAYLKNAATPGIQLNQANLSGVNLANTNLIGVNLKGSDLNHANLKNALLSGFRKRTDNRSSGLLYGYAAGLDPATFSAYLCQPEATASVPKDEELARYGVELIEADLSGANLQAADLSGALLPRANLTGANLSNANLSGACLSNSNLKNAILDDANLQAAQLRDVQLGGASMKGTRNADLANSLTAKQSKSQSIEQSAQTITGSMLRSQQAYFLEKDKFATKWSELAISGEADTKEYAYRIFSRGDRTKLTMVAAVPKASGLKSFVGLVNVGQTNREATTFSVLCVSEVAKPLLPKMPPAITDRPMACPSGFQSVK